MRLPNLLATPRGRLAAFFFLYVTEGIPLGFAATAVATQLRRQDVGPAEIGAFVGSFYLPWAFKWAFGPFIDVFASERLGRRRGWIIVTQVLDGADADVDRGARSCREQLALFTAVLLVHNSFGAMQDVAIDALAVNTLAEHERGLANGLMFAGAAIGQAVGGSGVLFLAGRHRVPADVLLRRRQHPGRHAVRGAADARGAIGAPRRARARRAGGSRSQEMRGVRGRIVPLVPRHARRVLRPGVLRCCLPARCAWAWRCNRTWRSNSASTTTRSRR